MAVPKRRWSKQRIGKRRSQWKMEAPNIVRCSKCNEFKLPHKVCKECGYYKGKEILKVDEAK